jgi:hypothetical protein
MAKKRAASGRSKKASATKKRAVPEATSIAPTLQERWLELTGKKLQPATRVPATLLSSIAHLHAGVVGVKPRLQPQIMVFAREVKGSGCDKKAQIAGWYEWHIPPACIGEAAVKALLDDVATQVCCDTLKCPEDCPCHYIPQAALAKYKCTPGVVEYGLLLQDTDVWNCECLRKPD